MCVCVCVIFRTSAAPAYQHQFHCSFLSFAFQNYVLISQPFHLETYSLASQISKTNGIYTTFSNLVTYTMICSLKSSTRLSPHKVRLTNHLHTKPSQFIKHNDHCLLAKSLKEYILQFYMTSPSYYMHACDIILQQVIFMHSP